MEHEEQGHERKSETGIQTWKVKKGRNDSPLINWEILLQPLVFVIRALFSNIFMIVAPLRLILNLFPIMYVPSGKECLWKLIRRYS